MKKRLLCLMASLLLCGAVSAQHFTAPDAHAKSGNTPIVAAVTVDNAAPATGAELAVYVGNELRGLATTTLDGKYWVQAFYNTGSTETLTFKLWDPTDEGSELTNYVLTYTYTDSNNQTVTLDALTTCEEGYGTPSNPVQIAFTATQTQEMQLASGWTWWSTPIEMEGNNGLQQLESSISVYGIRIMSQSGSLIKLPNGTWMGGISSIQNEQSYKINVSDVSTLTITGALADPNDHEITIVGGEWNWIGYPVSIQQNANAALANLEPANGDVLMGPEGSVIYMGGQWRPNMDLMPGYGYLYNSKASINKTFVYAVNRASVPSEIQEEPYWIANTHKYENCMVIAAVVYIGNEEQRNESLELGAFVNGECTGTAKLFYIEEVDRYFTVLTVGGEEGDRISFSLVDESKGLLYNESTNSLTFSINGIVGDFDNPYEIHFDATGIGENSMQVAMYPNPVDRGQSFKLNLPQEEEILDMTIINALGTIVRHETGALKSAMTGLPVAGVYTIKAVCRSGNVYYGRVVVK
jgi:hypothetical protein